MPGAPYGVREDPAPEHDRESDGENGEQDGEHAVGGEYPLLTREPLPAAQLAEEIVAEELERALAQVHFVEGVHEDVVAVQSQERDQVLPYGDGRQDREPEQERGES